jgi:sulfate/thiosulfate transport system ATP-binding protein
VIAGLDAPDTGSVLYQNQDVTSKPIRDRNVGFVFQHYALFRHMNVFENVAFGLRVRKWPQQKLAERVHELLRLIRLDGLDKRFPSQLSGGQRQRVALARALAAEPRLLLLDEPFGALDARVRQELRQWLRRLHDDLHVTSIFVTHDQEEAFAVADKVVVLRGGRIEQIGTPQEVFDHPANDFVMDFLGNVNVFHGEVSNGIANLQGLKIRLPEYQGADTRSAKVYVRPHELEIERQNDSEELNLRVRVSHVNPLGAITRVVLESCTDKSLIHVELSPERARSLALKIDEIVYVAPRNARVFDPDYSI